MKVAVEFAEEKAKAKRNIVGTYLLTAWFNARCSPCPGVAHYDFIIKTF